MSLGYLEVKLCLLWMWNLKLFVFGFHLNVYILSGLSGFSVRRSFFSQELWSEMFLSLSVAYMQVCKNRILNLCRLLQPSVGISQVDVAPRQAEVLAAEEGAVCSKCVGQLGVTWEDVSWVLGRWLGAFSPTGFEDLAHQLLVSMPWCLHTACLERVHTFGGEIKNTSGVGLEQGWPVVSCKVLREQRRCLRSDLRSYRVAVCSPSSQHGVFCDHRWDSIHQLLQEALPLS